MQNLTTQQKAVLEEELIDILIAWKKKTDAMRDDIAAAREAMAKAKKFRIWEGKYSSFREWLEKECGISQSWAYNLISAAKTVEAIEDAIPEPSEDAKPAEVEKVDHVRRTVRTLPIKTLKKLEKLKPLQALSVVTEASDEPINGDLAKRIQEKLAANPPAVTAVDRKVDILKAVDAEWESLKRGMAYVPLTPESVYKAIRAAIAKL